MVFSMDHTGHPFNCMFSASSWREALINTPPRRRDERDLRMHFLRRARRVVAVNPYLMMEYFLPYI